MIRVLVIANGSLLADSIVSVLSRQADMEVIRRSRDELGLRRDYSVVVIVDEGMHESESIKLKEVIRSDKSLLLIRVSLESRIVRVDESYELINPGMGEVVDLVRDFSRKHLTKRAEEDTDQEKKMNKGGDMQAKKYNRQNTNFPMKNYTANAQVKGLEGQTSIRVNRLPLLFEAWNSFTSLSLYQVRRRDSENVTLSERNRFKTGNNKV